ncbi:MAG: hypothetical protein QOK31_1727 [Solirubrobacteraceae bacterium]|jgi:uncharacterized membrane protein|nr:hypothetical protein [Solirubrobacteraceae bacterium]
MALDLAVLVFDTLYGAERAFADARERAGDEPWVDEVSFVEHHKHGRIVFRGTFAGRYVDVDDLGDAVGPDAVKGALTGALVGAVFGPPGFASLMVAGAAIGGYEESKGRAPEQQGPLFDEIRRDVPERSSAIVLLAGPEHVDAMVGEFEGLGGRLIRRTLPDDTVRALVDTVSWAPPAAEPQARTT